ncbi:MAG: DUF2309 domain-containing protein [Magnetococcales bacterium]|nr:DUF2309 domain-containing protein [Magnetococcales bacterium]MBF0437810.1 DUF2309 domain-containing protein [Magnetococcales bacterium]
MEHLVPGQAVITDFVHHNTLHGFQHYPFPKALIEARKVTGIYGYLPITRFRALYAQGRIGRDDLESVIAGDRELAAETPIGSTRRREILRLLLEQEINPLTAVQLAWEIEEQGALSRVHPAVDAQIRAGFQADGEAETVAELWQACLELFGLHHSDWYSEERLDLSTEEDPPFSLEETGQSDQQRILAQIKQEAERIWDELEARVGVTLTLRGLLKVLTGEDILDGVRPYLLRYLASFLDLGVAAWPLPQRQQGFYLAWRECAGVDMAFAMEETQDWSAAIAELPPTAMEAVEWCLNQIGLPESHWGGYLERLALELPGWSGMMMWRALRPGYAGTGEGVRVEMLDYLAVRLVLERLFAVRLCRVRWRLEPSLATLGDYFRRFPGELYGRWSLAAGNLPDFLAMRANSLLHGSLEDPDVAMKWRKLAFMIQDGQYGPQEGYCASRTAWPIFLLSQHLGWRAETLRQGGREMALAMLACLEQLDDEKSGYLWLQAYERHYRNQIFAALIANHGRGAWSQRKCRPSSQVIFCMDDREEGIRRHLEEQTPSIETLGAAGFFGVPVRWKGVDDASESLLCPVVVTPSHVIHERPTPGTELQLASHHRWLEMGKWGRELLFRKSHRGLLVPALLSMIVAPLVLLALFGKGMLPRLWGRLLGRMGQWIDGPVSTTVTLTAANDGTPATPTQPRVGFTDEEQSVRVAGFLRTIGLVNGFAPVVAILGHGGSSQNNPHLSAYDCGACSGRHGGPNARLFAAMANRNEVRSRLAEMGIPIPADTWFIGGEHDTGNEKITWFDEDFVPDYAKGALLALTGQLDAARQSSAHERARRLASAPKGDSPARALAHMEGRGLDFSQARPELGHATNAVALIGRRATTRGVFFDRRMFLISYDPTIDPEGTIVEAILLAAGPVGAGISLEYYFSTVDNDRFGCGSKVVHNITGLFGVMEGTGSDLRTGLPQQMIEIHEAMRLLVVVEQRPPILTAIYQRQPEIRELVGNGWIVLASLDPDNGEIHLFQPESGWALWENTLPPVPKVNRSVAWYAGHSGPRPPALVAMESV